ncbi:MAG: hypothetical protein Q9211_001874, partial [Gyalolechia sp. 1 TL-2023]
MLNALVKLQGVSFFWEDGGRVLVVKGNGGRLEAHGDELYLGNAGTASRFLACVATLAASKSSDFSILTGNDRMKKRPIGPLVEALQANGAGISYLESQGSLPLHVKAGQGMKGGDINLAATVSSQYVSSLLMCAPYAEKEVTLRLIGGKPISQLYIDMTTAMMASFGIHVRKSSTEEHTYHIPRGRYTNPQDYVIESDASSATYPLAIAAITGTTCTVPNIGSASLQGDARFAVDVLRPMGCHVEQTQTSTTVTGPPRGALKPIDEVDMEPMTDAFLTASVLAAVAQNGRGPSTTRIVGIANQRVKECNRIKAMKDELAKFGVTCRELPDGIEIDGISYEDLSRPTGGVHCYDDHRVAMSFSVLGTVAPQGTLLQERECVGKTWPGWWDTLRQPFGAQLEGVDLEADEASSAANEGSNQSIFIIGMRGAGKTTTGRLAAAVLGWQFLDLDDHLEATAGQSIPDMIKASGWDGFREHELAILKEALKEKPTGHIFACGGGIVEMQEARRLLADYRKAGGLVILVERDIEDVIAFLQIDKTRPAYVDDMREVWLRRKPWYLECSNYQFGSAKAELTASAQPFNGLDRFLKTVTGQTHPVEALKAKPQSFFVSLTVPDVAAAAPILEEVTVGSDAVELRVDLLEDPQRRGKAASLDFVADQVAILRASTSLPIIFTVRTQSQGGKVPDDAHKDIQDLLNLALRMGIEFLDLEIHLPEDILQSISQSKRNTRIIASHHDPKNTLSWTNGSWVAHYNKALLYGDIIKLVGIAKTQADNASLVQFRDWATTAHPAVPIIAINMGVEGQLSRIQNPFLTPVSHPSLPFKAAPGQLSAAEIRTALSLHGVIKPKSFYLFGKPISQSKSPAMHNHLFRTTGLPHQYQLHETDNTSALESLIRKPSFGGASVTIPLKIPVMDLLDEISPAAKTIGAVNTIVTDPSRSASTHPDNPYLIGHNTDWTGMRLVLSNAGAQDSHHPTPSTNNNNNNIHKQHPALVIGNGGTARAAIYTLHHMSYSPIYLLGRSPERLSSVKDSFPTDYAISLITTREAAEAAISPAVAIGTIPADSPLDDAMAAFLHVLLTPQDAEPTGTDKAR